MRRMKLTSGKNLIIIITSFIAAIVAGFYFGTITITKEGITIEIPKIEFAMNQIKSQSILGDEQFPTVDLVDGGKIEECPSEECAKGAYLPPLDISSPVSVYNSIINQCIDFDGAFGSQCFDTMAYFHYVYTGRWLSANGTGAAYGIWDARDYNNQGNEYELIYNPHDIKAGDWVVFHNGVYGHVGMAMGNYNNGYVALLGANQGGTPCNGGGAAVNVINMNLSSFSGAFRPRIWIEPEPQPTPTSNIYKDGDTFGQYLLDHNLANPETLWSEDIDYYNHQLYQQGILEYRDNHYYNNIPVGTEIKVVSK